MNQNNKKNKNKKKKNKNANRPTEDVTCDEREMMSEAQSHASEVVQDSGSEISLSIDADPDRHFSNGTAASFKEKIKELHSEKDALEQKEALLETRINQLLEEKIEFSQNEVSQKIIIQQLYDEKNLSMQNETCLRESIIQLNKEKDALIQRENNLEQKIHLLQREIDSFRQEENSAKESIVSLTDQNTRLQSQLIELEKSRDSLIEENQQLMEIISSLELQIKVIKSSADTQISSSEKKMDALDFTSEDGHEDANSHTEGAKLVVEKLITENSEHTEMVNELYPDVVQQHHPTSSISDGSAVRGDSMQMIGLSESTLSLEDVMLEDEKDGVRGIMRSEIKEIGGEGNESNRNNDVPLSDAPLIGAPFRFISFVARYVSGADLVDKNSQ